MRPTTGPRGAAGLLLLALAWAAGPQPGRAAEFAVTPSLRMTGEFNTNRLLRPRDTPDVLGAILEAGANFEASNGRTRVEVFPRARRGQYSEDLGLNRTDLFVDLDAQHALDERWRSALQAGFVRDSTVTSEAETEGQVFRATSRTERSLRPSLEYAPDARTLWQFSGGHTDVAYGETTSAFSDYHYDIVSAAWTRALDERNSLFVTTFHSWFESLDTDSRTRNLGLQVGWRRQWSGTLTSSLAVGGVNTWFDYLDEFVVVNGNSVALVSRPEEGTDQGLLVDLRLDKRWERLTGELSYARRVTPSGRGAQATADELVASLDRRLGERLAGRLDLRYLEEDYGGGGVREAFNRRRFRSEVSLRWQFSQFWSLRGAYSYVLEDSEFAPETADAHRFTVGLLYGGQRQSMSQ